MIYAETRRYSCQRQAAMNIIIEEQATQQLIHP